MSKSGKQTYKIKVLNKAEGPAYRAEVVSIGLDNRKTDENGCAQFYTYQDDYYPINIKYGNYESGRFLRNVISALVSQTHIC